MVTEQSSDMLAPLEEAQPLGADHVCVHSDLSCGPTSFNEPYRLNTRSKLHGGKTDCPCHLKAALSSLGPRI